MDTRVLYKDILDMLSLIQDDEKKLFAVLNCLENQTSACNKTGRKGEILSKYKDAVLQIANSIYNGFVCYLNPETLEVAHVQCDTYFEDDDYKGNDEDVPDENDLKFMKWGKYIKFKPLGPHELLRIMEKYVSQLKDNLVGFKLVSALEDYTPISSFLKTIDECGREEDWMEFRKQETNDVLMNLLIYD